MMLDGLEVAMDDAEAMGLVHGLACLDDVGHGLFDRDQPVLLNDGAKVRPFEVLEHHVRDLPIGHRKHADVRDPRDVVGFEPRCDARLALEAGDDLGVPRVLGAHELDGDRAAELLVDRRDDDAHAALAEDAIDAVLAGDHVAGRDWRAETRPCLAKRLLTPFHSLVLLVAIAVDATPLLVQVSRFVVTKGCASHTGRCRKGLGCGSGHLRMEHTRSLGKTALAQRLSGLTPESVLEPEVASASGRDEAVIANPGKN